MKRSVKILAVALVAVILCMSLVACGKRLSGTYEAVATSEGIGGWLGDTLNSGVEYTFKGSKVIIEVTLFGEVETYEGKYSIEDDKITFEFEAEDSKEADEVKKYSGTFDFEEKDNGDIKIGLISYEKQD